MPNECILSANLKSQILQNTPCHLIYLFNALYAIYAQNKALSQLAKAANKDTILAIFDYTNNGNYDDHRPEAKYNLLHKSLDYRKINTLLNESNWQLINSINLDKLYIRCMRYLWKK